VSEVVVGKDQRGLQTFFVQSQQTMWAQASSQGTWHLHSAIGGQSSSLGITHQQDNGEMILYGVFADGNLLATRESEEYSGPSINAYGTLAGSSVQINALNKQAWFTAAVMDGQLYVQWGSADNPLASGPCPGQMMSVTRSVQGGAAPSNLASLVPMPWLQTPVGFYCCVLDNTGNLSMVFDLSYVESSSDDCVGYGSFVPLTGQSAVIPSPVSAVTCAGALIDDSGMTRIYATDSNYQLWVLRQTGSTNNPQDPNPWSWTFWHPLGNNCTALCNGPGTNRTRELFVLDADSFLNLCSQETVSRSWQTALVRQPTGAHETPYYVAQYVTEITVYNESGNPEPNVLVTVSVAEPVSIWVSGKQYLLDATHSQPFNTNAMGKITFSTLALGLHTAELTLQAPGFAAPYTVYPPQNIHQQLAEVDAPTLTAAKARTQSVPSVVQSPLVDSQHQTYCAASATVMQDAFKIQQKHNIQPGAPGPVSPGTVLSVIPPSCPATGPWSDPGSWDSFWRDLAHFGEDIWHGIRNGILALENVAVDFEEGAIKLTVALEGLGAAVIKFVVKTIQDVVSAVSSAFRYLGAKIEQAIDWLKEFFDWGDILNTKRVMEYYLNEVLGNLVNNLDPNSPSYIQPLIEAQFEALIKLVVGDKQDSGTGVFSRAKQTFGTTTFNGTVAQTPVDPKVGSQGLQPTGTQNTFQAHQVKSSYARTKSETHIHQGGRVTPSGGGAACAALDAGALDDFFTLVTSLLKSNEQGSPYSQARAQLQANLKSLKHPRDLFSTALNDFLAMMKELVEIVIKIIEDVLLALLKIAGAGLAGFQDLLNYPLHIPVISWLYQQISDHPLTLLDLFCLIMAIPATLIYKLIWGGDQASPPFTSAQVQRITSRGIVWPQIQGTQIGMSATPLSQLDAAEASALSIVLGILSLVNGLAYGFIDFATDV
ncbi:MAG: hypothetical protein JSS02_25940, partial [Planctomycetes bacterium]|nr:hypothetical protein [Planctomycetota bacterium]